METWRGREGLERGGQEGLDYRGDVVDYEDRALKIEKESQIRSRLFPRYQTSFRTKIFNRSPMFLIYHHHSREVVVAAATEGTRSC